MGFVDFGSIISGVSMLLVDVGGENIRPFGISCVTFGTITSGSKISDVSPSPLAPEDSSSSPDGPKSRLFYSFYVIV